MSLNTREPLLRPWASCAPAPAAWASASCASTCTRFPPASAATPSDRRPALLPSGKMSGSAIHVWAGAIAKATAESCVIHSNRL